MSQPPQSSASEPGGRMESRAVKARHVMMRPLLCSSLVLVVFFASYELLERLWLAHSPLEHLFHIARGVAAALLAGGIVAWMILKSMPSIMTAPSRQDAADGSVSQGGEERARMYALWFIGMRWLAVLVSCLLVILSVSVLQILPEENWWQLVFIIGLLACCNVLYMLWLACKRSAVSILLAQGYVDVVVLTALLHFSGGVDNPLSPLMIFHVIIGGILLSRGHCYGIAALGSVLFGLLAVAEYTPGLEQQVFRVIPNIAHSGGQMLHAANEPLYVSGRVVVQAVILLLTAFFVTSLCQRLRANELRLQALAERAFNDRQLLESALETTGAALRLSDDDLRPYWWSKWWQEWLVCLRGEKCQGCPLLERDEASLRQSQADGRTRVTELVFSKKDCPSGLLKPGTRQRVFQITTAPLFDRNGHVKQLVELAQDVTAQKQTALEMMRAGKLAAVGELAGQVAHEVNNPIAIISAKASLLLSDHRTGMSAKVCSEIGKIKDLADRVARIAQGLLSYCRLSPGTRMHLDLAIPIRKALGMIEAHARKMGVQVEDELPAALAGFNGNESELSQVFLNLFLNALDAMPSGGRLSIQVMPGFAVLADGQPALGICVADTGCGISDEIREHVFDPFFTTKENGRGAGLGLSICLGLVRSHGGEIAIKRNVSQGTNVIVKLPMVASVPASESINYG